MTIEQSITQASAALHQIIEARAARAHEEIYMMGAIARRHIRRMAEYQTRSAGARQGWETRRGKVK